MNELALLLHMATLTSDTSSSPHQSSPSRFLTSRTGRSLHSYGCLTISPSCNCQCQRSRRRHGHPHHHHPLPQQLGHSLPQSQPKQQSEDSRIGNLLEFLSDASHDWELHSGDGGDRGGLRNTAKRIRDREEGKKKKKKGKEKEKEKEKK